MSKELIEDMVHATRAMGSLRKPGPPGRPQVRSVNLYPNSFVLAAFNNFATSVVSAPTPPGYISVKFAHSFGSEVTHDEVMPDILSLKPTTLREVCKAINQVTPGKALFATICGPPAFRISPNVATNILIQDTNGDFMMASIYNYVPADQNPASVFPHGSFMALLLPHMKFVRDDPTQNLFLRCDNPLAIRLFRSKAEWLQAQGKSVPESLLENQPVPSEVVADLRSLGNASYQQSRFDEAIQAYTDALAVAESACLPCEISVPLLSNRAQCFIRLELGRRALADAEAVLQHDATHQKCLLRRSRALLLMQGRWLEALDACRACADGDEQRQLLLECQRAIAESCGDFDELALIREAQRHPQCKISRAHADYFASNLICISSSPCGGRGIFTTRDVAADTLIMATKAFCSTAESDNPEGQLHFALDTFAGRNGTLSTGASTALPHRCIDTLRRLQAEDRAAFFALSSGPVPAGADDVDSLNIQRVKAILKYNAWEKDHGSGRSEVLSACHRIQLSTMLGRCPTEEEWDAFEKERPLMGSGLWVLQSLVNHSCCPNARVSMIGDFMFVRTVRPIQAGEEVFVSYIDLSHGQGADHRQHRKRLSDGWGFTCACERCRVWLARPEVVSLEKESIALVQEAMRQKQASDARGSLCTFGAATVKELRRLLAAWERVPEACQAMLVSVLEIASSEARSRGDHAAALGWSERIDAVRRATGFQCDAHSMQRNKLFQAGQLLLMGRRAEAQERMARARVLCGHWLLEPSEDWFSGMCGMYTCIVANERLGAIAQKMATEEDKNFRRADAERRVSVHGRAGSADAVCCTLPTIPPLSSAPALKPSSPAADAAGAASSADRPAAARAALAQRCSVCGVADSASHLMVCGGCRAQAYCSRACQRQGWPEHKRVCPGKAGVRS